MEPGSLLYLEDGMGGGLGDLGFRQDEDLAVVFLQGTGSGSPST